MLRYVRIAETVSIILGALIMGAVLGAGLLFAAGTWAQIIRF